jgi:hypothetical protein
MQRPETGETYEGKEARIELQGLAPLFPGEPPQEICCRARLQLLGAFGMGAVRRSDNVA